MHTISTRTPTPEEQRLIAKQSRPDWASYGAIVLFFALLPAYVLGKLGAWLGSLILPAGAMWGQWAGWLATALLFGYVLTSFARFERRRRQLAVKDLEAQAIQDIHVTDARVVQISLIHDDAPILALDIGDNKILFLQGQWLDDCATYGVEDTRKEPHEEFLNGLPAPHSFPSTEFTISRFPHSGEVTAIRVAGSYLPPGEPVDALKREYDFAESEILDGCLEDIAGVLEREHVQRLKASGAS
jgi:hypothetical protein